MLMFPNPRNLIIKPNLVRLPCVNPHLVIPNPNPPETGRAPPSVPPYNRDGGSAERHNRRPTYP